MGKTIRWSMKDPAGCVQRGQMPLSQLPGILRDFENSAAETLRRTGADHVLYAVKIYNTEDELTAVQFYMNPMSDEEFSKVAGKGRGTMVYMRCLSRMVGILKMKRNVRCWMEHLNCTERRRKSEQKTRDNSYVVSGT